MSINSPTNSRKIRTPSATVSRPGSSTPIVITSFAMKDVTAEFNPDSIQMLCPMEYEVIMDKLKDCDAIKYAAYRTATKLDILRTALRLDQVKLGAVTSAFHQHGFKTALTETIFDQTKATDVIADIFFSAGKIRPYFYPTIDVSACTEVSRRVAFAIYAEASVGMAFLKVFFTVLCEARLKDKLAYLFKDFSENGLMTKKGIKSLLVALTKISDFLGESASFGSHLVDSTVAQCLHVSHQKLLDEDSFFKWIFKEPQVIVWLPTFYRMLAAKSIRHDVRCANCKSQVIIGLRYQCLQCLSYDLCQHCFFYGLTSQNHKTSHPIQEYCYKSTRKEATRALLKVLANNVKDRKIFKRSKFRKRYLAHDPNMILENTINNDTLVEQPMTVEAFQLNHEILSAANNEVCSSGFHSVSTSSQSSQSPVNSEDPKKEDFKGSQINAILMTIEKENTAVLERLTSLQASTRNKVQEEEKKAADQDEGLTKPIDSCVTMQAQLNHLKLLMEGLFEFQPNNDGSETPLRSKKQIVNQRQTILMELQNSLNEPSLIESTPVITATQVKNTKNLQHANQFHKKKLSRLALDSNFSPIVNKPVISNTPVFDESVVVETLLVDEEVVPVVQAAETECTSGDPSLTRVNMSDISTFLAKSGIPGMETSSSAEITKLLTMTPEEEEELLNRNNSDLMEELEKIITKMDQILSEFKNPSLVRKSAASSDHSFVGMHVAEIIDSIQAHISDPF